MCGIAGIIVQPNSQLPDMQERLAAMRDAMLHRGPDDSGANILMEGQVGLVNRRLAIRDLSPAGHMPMSNAAGTIWITYNGEIYNTDEIRPELEQLGYSFCSQSDTEVILHGYEAWGEAVLQKLRGMFAFAVLDKRQNPARLFIARDRLGVKPLYYSRSSRHFVFASELRSLLASELVSTELSAEGLIGYLQFGSVPNPLTIYRDIRALEAGCSLTMTLDGALTPPTPVPYWFLPTLISEPKNQTEVVAQVRALLMESVRIRLVSDVPLGAFLSGGLDSSAVVALMRQATSGSIRTCSMVFEESGYSESAYAHAMAEHVGAEHFERTITAQEVLNSVESILRAMDQPSVDGINTYFVSQTARQAGLTVALSGLGGDELFGGYANTFQGVPEMLRVLNMVHAIPGSASLARAAINLAPNRYRFTRMAEAFVQPPSLASAYMTRRGLFSTQEIRNLVTPDIWETNVPTFDAIAYVAAAADTQTPASSAFAWVSRAELRTYTHHQLLRDTDVMSMAHSLEVRVPLLDHRLVELVLQLPKSAKVNGPTPKPLLMQAIQDLLPESIRTRRDKQGFVFPFERWLRGPMREHIRQLLSNGSQPGWLRPEAVEQVWRDYLAGRQHWSRVWALAALNGWQAQALGV